MSRSWKSFSFIEHLAVVAQGGADVAILEELLLHPCGSRETELREPARGDTQVGLQDPLELEQRLVVKSNVCQVRSADPSGLEAVLRGVLREPGVAFLPREALFLRRCDDHAVAQQASGAVVIKSGDAENVGGRHVGVRSHLQLEEQAPYRRAVKTPPPNNRALRTPDE